MCEELADMLTDSMTYGHLQEFYNIHMDAYYQNLPEEDLINEYVEEFSLCEEDEALLRLSLLSE